MAVTTTEMGRETEHEFHEGRVAAAIEKRTAKIPSDFFLWAAGASILLSMGLRMAHRPQDATFVGEWPPVFLLLGIYNKIVKIAGHD